MHWFGPEPYGSISETALRCETPDEPCTHCGEGFTPDDCGMVLPLVTMDTDGQHDMVPIPYHRECFIRTTVGSVAHQLKLCTCFGGELADEDSTLTKREAALAAVELFQQMYPLKEMPDA